MHHHMHMQLLFINYCVISLSEPCNFQALMAPLVHLQLLGCRLSNAPHLIPVESPPGVDKAVTKNIIDLESKPKTALGQEHLAGSFISYTYYIVIASILLLPFLFQKPRNLLATISPAKLQKRVSTFFLFL